MNNVMNAYKQSNTAGAEEASPHRLVEMLFDGAMERLSRAIGHCERGEVAAKGEAVGRAVLILESLRSALDDTAGDGGVARNLGDLYDYMVRRLTEANLHNDVAAMREVQELLQPIAAAWKDIPAEHRGMPAAAAGGEREYA